MSQLSDEFKTYSHYPPHRQIAKLYEYLEQPYLMPTERRWVNYKIKTLRDRLNTPSSRYKVVGSRRGGLTKSEKATITDFQHIRNIQTIIEESYVR